jgi:hypothetical protein
MAWWYQGDLADQRQPASRTGGQVVIDANTQFTVTENADNSTHNHGVPITQGCQHTESDRPEWTYRAVTGASGCG